MVNDTYYVIPDIHGCYDLMMKAMNYIFEQQDSGKIIFLGDYIDRGPASDKVLDVLMDAPPKGWEYICLKGNHEDMLIDAVLNGTSLYDLDLASQFSGEVPDYVCQWMQNLTLFHIVDKNIFVHADWDEMKSPEFQNETRMLWTRRPDQTAFVSDYFLTHGHTPREHGPVFASNRVNLDAGAVYYGTLLIGVYKYNKRGPQDIIRVTSNGVDASGYY